MLSFSTPRLLGKMIAKVNSMQETLKSGKSIPLLNPDEIKYTQAPIGNALYKNAIGRPPKRPEDRAQPHDRLICDICGGKFTRCHRSSHKKTKVHQAYAKMDAKLRRALIDSE